MRESDFFSHSTIQKTKLSGKFQLFNAIEENAETMKKSWILKNFN